MTINSSINGNQKATFLSVDQNADMRHIFMQSPVPMMVLRGKDYIVETANKGYLDIVEKGQDYIGKSVFDSLPELKIQGVLELLDGVMQTGMPFHGNEIAFTLNKNNKQVQGFYNFVYQPIREIDNTITGIIVVATEVTEQVLARKKVKESEAHFRLMADLMPTKISNADGEAKVIYFNKNWLDFTGLDFEELKNLGYHKIMHPDEIEEFQNRFQHAAETGTVLEMEMRFKNKNGDYIWHLNLASPVKDDKGDITMWIGSTTEIQKIKESESYFRLIAELMPEKVSHANAEGTILFYNKSWQNYTGASLNELVNNGWAKWIHADELQEATHRWLHSIKTGDDFDMQLRMLNHKGEYRWHNSSARAVKEEDGKTKLWIGYNTDIHEHTIQKENLEQAVALRTIELQKANEKLQLKNKEIQEAKEKLLSEYARSLIEASLDPLITISTEGVITDMNQATVDIFGLTREALTGTDFFNYFKDTQKAKEVYAEIFVKGFVIDYPLSIIDGKVSDVLFNGSVYKDEKGNVLGAVLVARDITEQRKIEKELLEAKVAAEMATVIAEVAQNEAESATHIAESAVKAKQQFLSNMSHEIRTPMNAIIGFTKVMLKTDLSAKQKEYLTAIKMSGDSLIVLINDILDLAKVEAGKMTFEKIPFKLASSISAMLHLFETKIQEKNLTLIKKYDNRIPDVLMGDPVRLHQIILNLVSNAVKFTNNGSITVNVRLMKQDDEKVTIEFAITDTGIGIEEDKIETIFENFQQASHKTARQYGGTGLGLAIVKQLVEPQGGIIKVKSTLDEGSTFSFTLDFQKTNEEAELVIDIMELDTDIKDIKVLVVEDMALNQLLMKTLLDDYGFERDIAENGKIAIEKLALKAYDIILMDLQMPEMNGFEATQYIRNSLHSKIPIIALTADVTTVDLAKCKAVGMNDYMAKPVDEKILYSKIIKLVKKATPLNYHDDRDTDNPPFTHLRCIDLNYLTQRTKSNPTLMMEMIKAYLEQTPPLITTMKQSFQDKNWELLYAAVHKIIPSFLIMGINTDFENMAKQIQEYARSQQQIEGTITHLVSQIENVCVQACKELEIEFHRIKSTKL